MSGDRNLAEDLFQEALIKVWQGIGKFDRRHKFSSWLFAIAHNVAIDGLRKNKTRRNFIHIEELAELPAEDESSGNPHLRLVARESREKLYKTVERLPEKQKNVLLLRLHGEVKFEEIAKLTGEPLNTVLGHMHCAVKRIKKRLRDTDGT